MVQSCFPSLAAWPLSAASRGALAVLAHGHPAWTTSPLKTRVGVSRRRPSGRLSRRRRSRPMFTPGSRACGYRTASGRAKWWWSDPNDGGIVLPDGTVYYPPLPLPLRNPPDSQDEIDAQIDALSGRSESIFQFCHSTANIGYEALELLPPAQTWQFVTGTNLRDEKVGLGQRALSGAGPTLKITAKGTVCCATVCVLVKVKRVNLPAWKKVAVSMEHITSGHMQGGSRVSSLKTLFPQHMTEDQVKAAVLAAYRNAKKAATQGNRVLLRGQCEKLEIDMWLNLETKTIETAYPVYP